MLKLKLELSNASTKSLLVETTSGIEFEPNVPAFDGLDADDDQEIEFKHICNCDETTLSEYNKIRNAFEELCTYFEVDKSNVSEDGTPSAMEIYFTLNISKEKFMKYLATNLFTN